MPKLVDVSWKVDDDDAFDPTYGGRSRVDLPPPETVTVQLTLKLIGRREIRAFFDSMHQFFGREGDDAGDEVRLRRSFEEQVERQPRLLGGRRG